MNSPIWQKSNKGYEHLEFSMRLEKTNVKISRIFSLIVSLLCCVFVVSQSVKCVKKLLAAPQGTHVKVKDTASESGLSITICHNDLNIAYAKILSSCNLT